MALTCMHCQVGTMVEPPSKHPGYLVCDTCNVIELTYEPLDYQESLHNVEYRIIKDDDGNDVIATQIIFVAGGRKSHSPLKTSQIRGKS